MVTVSVGAAFAPGVRTVTCKRCSQQPLLRRGWQRAVHGRHTLTPQATPDEAGPTDSGMLREELLMQRDMERYQQRAASAPPRPSASEEAASPSALDAAKDALDKLLIADFFAVLGILAWLGLGVGSKVALGSSALLDAWFPLWPLVFQPAIGVLMLGALASGAVGWARDRSDRSGAGQK